MKKRGGGRETQHWWEVTVEGHSTGNMGADNEWRDGNAYDFSLIVLSEIGSAVYRGVVRRGTGGRTEQVAGIN